MTSIPPELRECGQDVCDMLDNAEAVKGEGFVTLVTVLHNVSVILATVKRLCLAAKLNEEQEEQCLTPAVLALSSICATTSELAGVNASDCREATKLADAIIHRIMQTN